MAIKRSGRLISFFTTLCMVVGTVLSVNASVFTAPVVKLEQTSVTISGTAATGTTVACIVLKPGYTDINTPLAGAVKEAYQFLRDQKVTDGTYRFTYQMKDEDASGDYLVFVGYDGTIPAGVPYYYASGDDREEAMLKLNAVQQASQLEALLIGQEAQRRIFAAMGFAVDAYSGLSADGKASVNEKLFRGGIDYTGENAVTEAVKIFADAIALAVVNGAAQGQLLTLIGQNNSLFQLDLSATSLYGKLEKEESALLEQALYQRLPLGTVSEAVTAFEQELRVPYLNRIAYGQFLTFCQAHNSYLAFDLDKYTALDDTGKTYVAKQMADATFTSIAQARTKYAELVQNAPKDPVSSGTGGGGGGGKTSTVYADPVVAPPVDNGTDSAETAPFHDLGSVPWAQDSILKLAELGVVSGDGTGSFRPDDAVKREEFLKMALEAFGLANETETCDFADVPQTEWYYKYVASGVSKGIVNGMEERIFGIGREISRQDMTSLAYRIAQYAGVALPGGQAAEFSDAQSIADYAKAAVNSLSAGGIVSGAGDGSFQPEQTATRAQACKIIAKLLYLAKAK